MAEVKGLKAGATGIEQLGATDTFPVANIPAITSAGVSDFTEAVQDAQGWGVLLNASDLASC